MTALERAQEHHRDACLDNHSEEDCVAIQLAQELEPAPCVMTHTEPFDFAQCETHDTTFPLGGTCKFNGREVWELYADEADEQRQRAVRHEFEVARDVEKLRGDIHHLISPIIGALRLSEHHKEPLTEEDLRHMISRLYVTLSLMDEAVVGTIVPDEVRGKYGVGLNHYPSLVDPDASPCIGAPHWEKS